MTVSRDKIFIRPWNYSYLQQDHYFVHELQTLLRIAAYENSKAIFCAVGAEN